MAAQSEKFSFTGWNVWEFIKGRKRLLVTMIGGLAGWVATQDPALSALSATGAEFLYAVIDYYFKE